MSSQTAAPTVESIDEDELKLYGIDLPPEPPPRLLRLAVTAGAALVAVQVVYLLCVVYMGLSLQERETLVAADATYRIGVSFSSHVHMPTGLCLLAGVVLLATPALSRTWRDFGSVTRSTALIVVQGLAALTVVGAILGVRSTVFFLPPLAHHLSSSLRWELASYVVATAGTAAIAFAAAFMSMPRFLAPADQA